MSSDKLMTALQAALASADPQALASLRDTLQTYRTTYPKTMQILGRIPFAVKVLNAIDDGIEDAHDRATM